MNEKYFFLPLLAFMGLGLLAIVVVPAAHIGMMGFALGKVLAYGILAVLVYLAIRKRYRLRYLSQRGFVRRFFWALLSIPSILLASAVAADAYSRRFPAFEDAMSAAQQSEVVKTEIGTPARVGWPMESDTARWGNQEHRLMRVAISGGKGQGYLRIVGTKKGGAWRLEKLSLFAQRGENREVVLFDASKLN